MIEVGVPGYGDLELSHLVMDFNGTLAWDGRLIEGVAEAVARLSKRLEVHVLTADTFGRAEHTLAGIPCDVTVLDPERQDEAKREYVEALGPEGVVAIGNGRNDRLMLQVAAIGVAVVQEEGAAGATIAAADVVCRDIRTALDLLRYPLRLTATLRS